MPDDTTPPAPARALNTTGLATASGYSVQQVRDLERLGVIPPARRAANGYRQFTPEHLLALRAYRKLAEATGPVTARRTLRQVRRLPLDHAAALISSLHVALAREREDALAARRALRIIHAEADEEESAAEDTMTITELADALGVRTSTLRFWEQAGLLAPERASPRAVRRYPPAATGEARIVATLRAAGYRIPDVHQTIEAIRRLEDLDRPLHILDARLEVIARRTLALFDAGAHITELITANADTVGRVNASRHTHQPLGPR